MVAGTHRRDIHADREAATNLLLRSQPMNALTNWWSTIRTRLSAIFSKPAR